MAAMRACRPERLKAAESRPGPTPRGQGMALQTPVPAVVCYFCFSFSPFVALLTCICKGVESAAGQDDQSAAQVRGRRDRLKHVDHASTHAHVCDCGHKYIIGAPRQNLYASAPNTAGAGVYRGTRPPPRRMSTMIVMTA